MNQHTTIDRPAKRPLKAKMRFLIIHAMFAVSVFQNGNSNGEEVKTMFGTNIDAGVTGKWVLVVHGGASSAANLTPVREASVEAGIAAALSTGSQTLREGGTALDAVEAAVRVLEDDLTFNAGRGAKMTIDGQFELDASIMCGQTLQAGAVAAVRTVANPISLARAVMDRTKHVLLASDGADAFARSLGIPPVEQNYFFDQRTFDLNNKNRVDLGLEPLPNPAKEFSRGTVGAVALDMKGNIAAATSTGGVTGKMTGRVGDSPIIGAGTYARNDAGAISCTGIGEEFIRHQAAFQAAMRTKIQKISLQNAIEIVLEEELPENAGGMIGVDKDGHVVMSFTTEIMNRGFVTSDGRTQIAIRKSE